VAPLEKGAIFARRYRIVRLIATGGMGAVYEVVHLGTERRLALKVMHPHVLAGEDARERFKREARISGRVEDDHIVDVFDAGVDEPAGTPFLVMELLAGEDLGERLRRLGRLPPAEVVAWLSQAALALDKTHRARIVHRDLKPRNLFLAEREGGPPRIKVLDFGIAKMVAEGASCGTTQILGTPLYMAPEQLDGDARLTAAADIYALGMVAYTLLVGAPYFEKEAMERGVLALAAVIARGAREPARARAAASGAALPGAFDAWFARATAPIPQDRFASAIEAVRALAEALGAGAAALPPAPPGRPRGPSPSWPTALSANVPSLVARSPWGRVLAASVAGIGLAFALGRSIRFGLHDPACKPNEAACGERCADTSADPDNCGACGHSCMGGACEAGVCQPVVLADHQDTPIHLVTYQGRVFWINVGSGDHGGEVKSVRMDGTGMTTLASGQGKPSGMATDGVYVYWVNYGDGTVYRVPIGGGEPKRLAEGQLGPRSIAVGPLGIYWTNREGGTVIFRSNAGETTELANGQDQPGDIAIDAERVYWADRGGRRVMAVSLQGGKKPTLVGTAPEPPIGVAVDAKRVYWIEYQGDGVMWAPIGGGPPKLLTSGQSHPLAIAVDASRVYLTKDDGAVMAISLDGGDVTRLCFGQGWPQSLAVDAKSIYWTNTKGQVMRLAK
jgi:eukaryotic-like serine/threonine-protein kinase